MSKGMVVIGIIVMALLGIFAVNMITSQQTGQELDYYLLKDTTAAAMEDALDDSYYAQYGIKRMDKEKFVESFIKRFADGVDATRNYNIKFYDLNETPPKVSVKVTSKNNSINKDGRTDIITSVDMVMEDLDKTNVYVENLYDPNNQTSTKNMG